MSSCFSWTNNISDFNNICFNILSQLKNSEYLQGVTLFKEYTKIRPFHYYKIWRKIDYYMNCGIDFDILKNFLISDIVYILLGGNCYGKIREKLNKKFNLIYDQLFELLSCKLISLSCRKLIKLCNTDIHKLLNIKINDENVFCNSDKTFIINKLLEFWYNLTFNPLGLHQNIEMPEIDNEDYLYRIISKGNNICRYLMDNYLDNSIINDEIINQYISYILSILCFKINDLDCETYVKKCQLIDRIMLNIIKQDFTVKYKILLKLMRNPTFKFIKSYSFSKLENCINVEDVDTFNIIYLDNKSQNIVKF